MSKSCISKQEEFHRKIYQLFEEQTVSMIFKFFKNTVKERKVLHFSKVYSITLIPKSVVFTEKEKPDQIRKNINGAKIL